MHTYTPRYFNESEAASKTNSRINTKKKGNVGMGSTFIVFYRLRWKKAMVLRLFWLQAIVVHLSVMINV